MRATGVHNGIAHCPNRKRNRRGRLRRARCSSLLQQVLAQTQLEIGSPATCPQDTTRLVLPLLQEVLRSPTSEVLLLLATVVLTHLGSLRQIHLVSDPVLAVVVLARRWRVIILVQGQLDETDWGAISDWIRPGREHLRQYWIPGSITARRWEGQTDRDAYTIYRRHLRAFWGAICIHHCLEFRSRAESINQSFQTLSSSHNEHHLRVAIDVEMGGIVQS